MLALALAALVGLAPADTIDFVPLVAGRLAADCAGDAPPDRPCRVRRQRDAAGLRALLARGPVVREGDALTFTWQGAADEVELTGGVQVPMSRVRGTDLWTVTVRVPELDRALVTYGFLPITGGTFPRDRLRFAVWRGPRAAPPADSARALAGRVIADTLPSRFLPGPRGVTVYVPPSPGGAPPEAVVYVGDGQAVSGMAPLLDTLITSGRAPRVLLVGTHSAPDFGGTPGSDGRALEYLLVPEADSTRFLAHERFLLEEVLPWSRERFGAPAEPARTAILGFSNGAALAIDMGLRHPDRFGHVLAFSPAGRRPTLAAAPRGVGGFYLLAGLYEPPFLAKAREWARLFGMHGVRHALVEVPAGHDPTLWNEALGGAVAWAFGGGK